MHGYVTLICLIILSSVNGNSYIYSHSGQCQILLCSRLQVWINAGDIILLGLRDYQDGKADVILRYNPDEARSLKAYGELPESVKVNDTVIFGGDGDEDEIQFDDIDDDGEEEADIDAI